MTERPVVDQIRDDLLDIEQSYVGYKDGGYALVDALCRYRSRLSASEAQIYDGVLLEWVRGGDARFWGVALEALARGADRAATEELRSLWARSDRESEWASYVRSTLERLGALSS